MAVPLACCLLEGNSRTRPVEKPAVEGSCAPLLLRLRAGLRGYWIEDLLAGFSAGLVKMVAKGPFGEILRLLIFIKLIMSRLSHVKALNLLKNWTRGGTFLRFLKKGFLIIGSSKTPKRRTQPSSKRQAGFARNLT